MIWNASLQAVVEAAAALNLPCRTNDEVHLAAETLYQIRPNPEIRYTITLLHASLYPEEATTPNDPTEWQ